MNLAVWLQDRALRDGARPALYSGQDLVADYATFARRAAGLAAGLARRGIAPGDRVAIFLPNGPDYLVALFGIWWAGAAAVPVNAKLHARELDYILGNAEAALLITTPQAAAQIQTEVPTIAGEEDIAHLWAEPPLQEVTPRAATDLAWLFYTSGTTGTPKGVCITHGMLLSMALCYGTDVDQVSSKDTALYAAPLSHGAGLYSLMHVRAGARHVCPASGGFDPAEIFALAAHHGRVHMFAAPTMVRRLTDHAGRTGLTGEGLRTIVYAGGPMYSADILDAVARFGPVFVQIYGQGECPMGITALSRADVADRNHPNWQARLASVGRAQSAVEVRVGDASGVALRPGEEGEIMVRGATVMRGYWNNADATARTLVDGWLRTGDVGHLDEAGYLTLTDRSKDVIITGGSNVYPREVEEVLLTHAGVREAAVVGRPHADWGEEVVAFVVGEAAEAELEVLCLERIARFKRPKAYLRLEELPKNNYGKVLKTALREML
ncbi:MAG: AMP-binding protein [Sulfitobacter sp.]|nr:AMP-binding protein [Sulfitobacter sp.]